MIVGLGHDLCEVDRIEALVIRWGARFTERVFTEGERAYSMPKVLRAQHLAGRFNGSCRQYPPPSQEI